MYAHRVYPYERLGVLPIGVLHGRLLKTYFNATQVHQVRVGTRWDGTLFLVALLRSHALALAAFGGVRVERVGGEGPCGW